MSNATEDLIVPSFFSTVSIPAVAKWAADKVKEITPDSLFVEGREVLVKSWIFEGKFPRRPKGFYGQWDYPSEGRQYTLTVRCFGGEYRSQKPTCLVCFTQYESKDGLPLPL